MSIKHKLTDNEMNLIRRYLVWCYKTTKEDLDRIERYYTQNIIDNFLLDKHIHSKEFQSADANLGYKKMVEEFEEYKIEKLKKADQKKYTNKKSEKLSPEFIYLRNRLEAVEKAICHFLSEKDLCDIQRFYEEEMTGRILKAVDHT